MPKQLIQVSADIENPKTREREIAPLINAARQFNIKDCLILTDDQNTELKEGKLKIKVMPVWRWLLG